MTTCINKSSSHSDSHVRSHSLLFSKTHTNCNLFPFHLKCRAGSPSPSVGSQSPTTDIRLIARCGPVVYPHSHPDPLCAETPTMENSGLRGSEGLQTEYPSCLPVFPLILFYLRFFLLECCRPEENSKTQKGVNVWVPSPV